MNVSLGLKLIKYVMKCGAFVLVFHICFLKHICLSMCLGGRLVLGGYHCERRQRMSDYIWEVINKLTLVIPAFIAGLLIGLQHKDDKKKDFRS